MYQAVITKYQAETEHELQTQRLDPHQAGVGLSDGHFAIAKRTELVPSSVRHINHDQNKGRKNKNGFFEDSNPRQARGSESRRVSELSLRHLLSSCEWELNNFAWATSSNSVR